MAKSYDQTRIEESKDSNIFIHQGVPGLKHNSGYLDEEWHPKLKGTKARKKYREMADNSPVVGASLWIMEAIMRQSTWTTKANEKSRHSLAQYGVDFSEQCFEDMGTPWKETLSEILSMLVFGWCALEPEFKLRRGDAADPLLYSRWADGKIGWRDWGPRSQESLERWVFDTEGNLIGRGAVVGMMQRDPINGRLHAISMDRLLLFRIRARKNNPEGTSLLRTSHRPYYKGMMLEDIESIGVERNVAGLPDYQVPLDVMEAKTTGALNALNQAKTLVKKSRMDQYYGIVRPTETDSQNNPTGYKFQLISSSGRSFADTGPIVQRYDTRIAQNLMTEFVMLGTQQVGTHAAHSDKTTLLGMAVDAILDIVDDVVNEQALPWLFQINNLPRDIVPERRHTDVEKRAVAETLTAVSTAVSSGAMEGDDSVNNFCRALIDLEPSENRPLGSMLQDAAAASRNLGGIMPQQPQVQTPVQQDAVPGVATQPQPDPDPGDDGPDYWTLEEAAETLRVSTQRLRNAIRRGQLPGLPIGNTFRLKRAEVEALFAAGAL